MPPTGPRTTMRWARRVAACAAAAAAVAACCQTPKQKQFFLSLVFDGVPDPDAPKPVIPGSGRRPGAERAGAPQAAQPGSVHKPYAAGACNRCHEGLKQASGGMPFAMLDVKVLWKRCRGCHASRDEVGERAVILREGSPLHGPVAAGECESCHVPHDSAFVHLLRGERVEASCLKCHDQLEKRTGSMAPMDCTSCHDPHVSGTAASGWLRGGVQAVCTGCHSIRKDERPWLHGPVAAGQCIQCHDSHGRAGSERHVRRPISAVCTRCHDRDALPQDQCSPSQDCDACHEPHAARSAADLFLRARIDTTLAGRSVFDAPPADSARGAGAVPPPAPPAPEPEAEPVNGR